MRQARTHTFERPPLGDELPVVVFGPSGGNAPDFSQSGPRLPILDRPAADGLRSEATLLFLVILQPEFGPHPVEIILGRRVIRMPAGAVLQ